MSQTPVRRREVAAWALYDAANSAFPLVIVTAVFSRYFKYVIVGGNDPAHGDLLWGISLSLSAALVALTSPFLGAIADRRAWRKRLLGVYTAVAVLGTIALSQAGAGMVAYAMAVFVIANAAFEGGMVFYGSLLPSIAKPSQMGRISGIGWSAGYLGGLACLIGTIGFATDGKIPLVILIVAAWFAIWSTPLFTMVKERQPPTQSGEPVLAELWGTVKKAFAQRDIRRFFIAYFIYNDAIVTTIGFAALFATDELGFDTATVIKLVMAVQVTGAIGAFGLGRVADRIGNERAIFWALILWILVAVTAFATAMDLAIWESSPDLRGTVFWATGLVLGAAMGAAQSASRAFLASAIPSERSGEFFGIYAIAGRFSAILGPTLFGLIALWTGSKAWSVLTLGVMFTVGAVIISSVKSSRAREELAANA